MVPKDCTIWTSSSAKLKKANNVLTCGSYVQYSASILVYKQLNQKGQVEKNPSRMKKKEGQGRYKIEFAYYIRVVLIFKK